MDFIRNKSTVNKKEKKKKSFYESPLGAGSKQIKINNRHLEQQQVSLIEHKNRDHFKRDEGVGGDTREKKISCAPDDDDDDDDDEQMSARVVNMGSATTQSTSTSCSPANQKTSKSTSKAKWILISLMGCFFIVTAILIAILSITLLLENEDQCFNENSPFQQPSYKLFATKTLYSTAFNYLSKPSATTTNTNHNQPNPSNNNNNNIVINLPSNSNNNNNNNYDKSSINLPKIFTQTKETLETINQRLTSPEFGCKVRQFHYFGRHSARLPSSDGIAKINEHIHNVQSRIDLAKYQEALNNPFSGGGGGGSGQQQQQQQQPSQQTQQLPQQNNGLKNASTQVCFDPLVQYKQWASFASPEQGNLVMESGARETAGIAHRFKALYPEMFDSNLTKLVIGTTDELRTAQTALTFLKQFDNFALDFCGLDEFPSEDTSDKNRAQEIENNGCFRKFLRQFSREKLYFHKSCKSLHKDDILINHSFNLKEPNRTEFISVAVSKKLKLGSEQQLTSEETYALYNACRYESALTGATSIWCNLFNERQLKFYELLADIDDYYNQAFGHPDQSRSACPLTVDLMRTLRLANRPSSPPREAHFYFTHSEVIQRLLAATIDLSDEEDYSPRRLLESLRLGQAPRGRNWQTSLFTPFSANLAFTLYSCPKSSAAAAAAAAKANLDDTLDLDVSDTPFKVVAALNEQPIVLEGCADVVCDLFTLSYQGRLNREKKCKLEEICKNNVVFT